ncbi:MAG TPA: hypothetical protein VFO55_01980 [Gemmatimonadaceae bacterium]|nr:hypothetical protein [Gemmatimonadaceae bacterium]
MTRIASKFGIAAALTLGMLSTAAAQGRTTNPTTTSTVSKGEVARVDTVRLTIRDTVTVYRRDTVTVTGPTVTRWDTVRVEELPGWLERVGGAYFGLGAGAFYPSAGIGQGQIPGYAFQMNLGVDPVGSPLGFRVTANLARPDEAQPYANLGPRPTIMNLTGDLKLRLPFFSSSRFPQFGLYGIGGLAYIRMQGVREQSTEGPTGSDVVINGTNGSYTDTFGYTVGGGGTLNIGHKRELFLEARVINWNRSGYEGAHQFPLILGINWY